MRHALKQLIAGLGLIALCAAGWWVGSAVSNDGPSTIGLAAGFLFWITCLTSKTRQTCPRCGHKYAIPV